MSQPVADIRTEAERLLRAANGENLPVRLLGGLAVWRHAGEGIDPNFEREYKDIDFATGKRHSDAASRFFVSSGYRPDVDFNGLNGHRRLLFYDVAHERQIDVFVGSFSMCHTIPFADRLECDSETLPLAELVLTKLQIWELNTKDQSDLFALFFHHEVGTGDADAINAGIIANLCARDWGLWRTCQHNIERMRRAIDEKEIPEYHGSVILQRLDSLCASIAAAEKTRSWRLRSRVGDRIRWYEEPEEVG